MIGSLTVSELKFYYADRLLKNVQKKTFFKKSNLKSGYIPIIIAKVTVYTSRFFFSFLWAIGMGERVRAYS